MHRSTIALAALVGLVAAVLVVTPAQAATYGVTLTVGATRADVGTKVVLSGAVSGSKAAKKTVLVQRRVGTGAWKTIAKPRTSSSKRYSYSHQVSVVGPQQFRVVAPKKGSTQVGTSPRRGFTGFTWLWLAQQPHFAGPTRTFWDATLTVGGVARPHSILSLEDGHVADWQLGGRCDRADIRAAVDDAATGYASYSFLTDIPSQVASSATAQDNLRPVDVQLNKDASTLVVDSGGNEALIIVSPRVHCSVSRLPGYVD